MQPSQNDVPALVDRWVTAGIITPEQADRIRADLATLPSTNRPVSLVAEALGYLGGVIVLVGLGLVVGLTWDRLTPAWQVGIATGIAIALGVAGAFIPAHRLGAVGRRLRGVLWLAASIAVFVSLILLGDEVLDWNENQFLLLGGAGAAVASAVLWALNRHVLQHISVVVATAIGAASGTMLATDSSVLSSLSVWAVGVVWFSLSVPDLVPQQSGGVLGSLSAVIGSLLMFDEEWGPLMALGTVVALVVAAVIRRQLAVLGVGSVGALIALPATVDRYFDNVLLAALSLVAGGLALVGVAIFTARRRRPASPA